MKSNASEILSAITKQLYSFNLTIELETGNFSLISGTGMEEAIDQMNKVSTYRECSDILLKNVTPEFRRQVRELIALDFLRDREGQNGFVGTLEYAIETEGHRRWREINVFMGANDEGGATANILGRDITSRHEEADALNRELKAAAAKDNILSGITQALYSYNITVNLKTRRYTLITGTGLPKLVAYLKSTDDYSKIADHCMTHVPKEYRVEARRRFGADRMVDPAFRNGFVGRFEFPSDIEGAWGWHEINVFRSVNEYGDPIANILGRDVTEVHASQERHERELRAAAAKDNILSTITKALYSFNLTVNLASQRYDLIIGTGMEQVVAFFQENDQYQKAFDYKLGLVDREYKDSVRKIFSIDAIRGFAAAGRSGLIETIQYSSHVEGKAMWHEMSLFIGTDANGEPVANVLGRDITEQHRQEQIESDLLAQRRANEAKSYFFSTVSHDIRTPLNAICGFAEILEMGVESEEDRKNYISSIRSSGKLLLELINDVLDLSKLESGKMEIVPEPTNLHELVDEVVRAFSVVKASKRVALAAEFHEVPRFVQVDPQRVRQILFNLIGNAMKFTDRGSVTVILGMTGNELTLAVRDTGCGIPESQLASVLQPYVQINTGRTTGGTGLGLAICKQLAERMGGTISVASKVGEGSVFTLHIPNVATIADTQDLKKTIEHVTDSLEKPLHVLAVDDVPVNLKLLGVFAKKLGITRIDMAANGREGLALVEREFAAGTPFDLVLTDMWMPEMDGEGLCRALRGDSRFKQLRIVALTADIEANKNFREIGFDGIVLKPMTLDKLRSVITGE